jgi:tRNA(Ile)-lysidine synthase
VNLIDKVKAAIERENLIPDGTRVVVGISGGADSVALLHILHRLGYLLLAAHMNHSIRGAEADGDEAFVKTTCSKLKFVCYITDKVDVPALAKAKGISIEMAAREARHKFFRDLKFGPNVRIALAHHADDQLENFFLRAARGAGSGGLSGMRFVQELEGLTLIRPLLGIRRAEIIQWLKENKIKWREDATNTDETVPRNLVRRRILPLLEQINFQAAENILRTMEILREEDDFLSVSAELRMEDMSEYSKAIQRRIIQRWLIARGAIPGFDSIEKVIEFAAETAGSRSLDLEGLRIVNEYGTLKTVDATPPSRFSIRIEEGVGILRGPWCASVSLAKVAGREVTVRAASPGDRMEPYGMEGSKKLQDIFTDPKIPKAQRENWPVAECGGEIIWLPGYRIARGWELSSDCEPALHLFSDEGERRHSG